MGQLAVAPPNAELVSCSKSGIVVNANVKRAFTLIVHRYWAMDSQTFRALLFLFLMPK
jgi:hypothetical protein